MKRLPKIQYKTFQKGYFYTDNFDEDAWLNKIGLKGWVLIGETHETVYSSGDRTITGKFRRPNE